MSKRKQSETIHDDGTYVVRKSRKQNMIAFILCLLIAVVIWLYASNLEQRKKAEEQQSNGAATVAAADVSFDPLAMDL